MNLLIVDDEYYSAEGTKKKIAQKGPLFDEIFCAYNMTQALEYLAGHSVAIMILDIEMPGGSGLELLDHIRQQGLDTICIFLTAYAKFEYISKAMRLTSIDYLLKPVSWKRLSHSLERFVQFREQQRVWKIVDQQNVDSLYQLQARSFRPDSGTKGIEENTLTLVQRLFVESREQIFSVDDVVSATGLSKTTTRRYLEHCVESGFLTVEMLYGKIGHPRRLYRRAEGEA